MVDECQQIDLNTMEQSQLLMTTRFSMESNTTTSTSGYSSVSFNSSLDEQPSENNDEDTSQHSNLSLDSSKETSPDSHSKSHTSSQTITEISDKNLEHRNCNGKHQNSPRHSRVLPKWDTCDSEDSESGGSVPLQQSPVWSPGQQQPSMLPHAQLKSGSENGHTTDPDISRYLSAMCLGTSLTKVKRHGKTTMKMLYLDSSRRFLRWKPSKKGNKAKIHITNIKEIREGASTDGFRRYALSNNQANIQNCFSIIYGMGWESLDLIAESAEDVLPWIRGLQYLIQRYTEDETKQEADHLRNNWLKAVFKCADKSGDGLLDMDEVLKLLHKMNVNFSKRKVKQLFQEADSNTSDENEGQLDFEEFVCFYKRLSTRPELFSLLQEYGSGKDYLSLQDFELFLRIEQGRRNISQEEAQEIMQRFEPVPENLQNNWLGIDGFTRYLVSQESDLFNVDHRPVNQDMTYPLCHYYIASSHNTYLIGDQVLSQSSVDVYGAVLQSGCRCVEMDCWDGKDGDPVVYHGYTLTTKIKCRDVIETINKYAFIPNPYPIILSIENHCSLDQQKKLAYYLQDIFGDKLMVENEGESGQLPSPEDLKGKILIKTQKLPLDHDIELDAGEVSEEDSADELEDDFKLETSGTAKFENLVATQYTLRKKTPINPNLLAWQRIANKRKSIRSESSESDGGDEASPTALTCQNSNGGMLRRSFRRGSSAPGLKKKSIILSKHLSDLVKYTKSVSFKGFLDDMSCCELPSLGEMRANNLVATRAKEFLNFTSRNMCRVYPSAYRIDSSNYNPQPMWNCGCQLVALNYQTEGRAMQLARAKFKSNGNCGYVLKPKVMREEDTAFEPNVADPTTNQKKLLTIRVISGQQLPKPPQSLLGERGEIIDPYVEVEIIGLPVDCLKAQTKTIQDNGFNPNWNQTMFFTVHLPDVALIRFVVWDEDPIGRDFIGQATYAISSLTPGYRHVHLEGLDYATVFVHVMIEDFDEKALQRLSKTKGTHKHLYARTKAADIDIPVTLTSSKMSPRRRLSFTHRFNVMRRHTTASIFQFPEWQTQPSTQSKRLSLSFGGTGRLEEDGQEAEVYEQDKTLVATDTILFILEYSTNELEVADDGSTNLPLFELFRVFNLNIPISAILTGIRQKKLSLRCGKPGCGDVVEGGLDIDRTIIYDMWEDDGYTSEFNEFQKLLENPHPVTQVIAPNGLQLSKHAFVGLDNIAERLSEAGTLDHLSSSSESMDDISFEENSLFQETQMNGAIKSIAEEMDEECNGDVEERAAHMRLKSRDGEEDALDQRNYLVFETDEVDVTKGFEKNVDVFAGEYQSRLSVAMEDLNSDLMTIIANIQFIDQESEPLHESTCDCDVCVVEECNCCSKRRDEGTLQKVDHEHRAEEDLRTKEGAWNSNGKSIATTVNEMEYDHVTEPAFINECVSLAEPEIYDSCDETMSNKDIEEITQAAEEISEEEIRRKEISEKYGVTLRDKVKHKKGSLFSLNFKSRDRIDELGLVDIIDSQYETKGLKQSSKRLAKSSYTISTSENSDSAAMTSTLPRDKRNSRYGTLSRWKRFTTGAFLSRSLPDVRVREDIKRNSALHEDLGNGSSHRSSQNNHSKSRKKAGDQKKPKVFFFMKM